MRLSNGDVLLAWPLAQHIITAGWTYNSWSAHNALDFRALPGTPVFAPESGTVDWVQDWDGHTKNGMQSYGTAVRIKHADYAGGTLQTRSAHLSKRLVNTGDRVAEGQLIGYSGQTGNCYGAHLHFEVIWKGVRRNPLCWLDNDFSCANDNVKQHLGKYASVVRPAVAKLYDVLVSRMSTGDKDAFVALAKEKGVPYSVSEVQADGAV